MANQDEIRKPRKIFATKTSYIFSIAQIAKEFINTIEKVLDSKMTQKIPEPV